MSTISAFTEPLNPFRYNDAAHRTICQTLKMLVVGLFLLIPRILIVLFAFVLCVLLSAVAVCCRSRERLTEFPFQLCWLRWSFRILSRIVLFCFGFMWVTRNGTQHVGRTADGEVKHAPILVSNHSSVIDAIYYFSYHNVTFVGASGLHQAPCLNKIGLASQAIAVNRDSHDSRAEVAHEIQRRAHWKDTATVEDVRSYGLWPPTVIFPEATCTNATALIQFKAGAFAAGAPVQPVVLRYPYRFLDVSWCGSCSILLNVLHMMCQVYNRMEVTYLPVYVPNAEESTDALRFAQNVRDLMAASLGVPQTEHNLDDFFLLQEAHKLHVPLQTMNLEMGQLNRKGIGVRTAKEQLRRFAAVDRNKDGMLDRAEFGELMNLSAECPTILDELFRRWDRDGDGLVNFRDCLLFTCAKPIAKESLQSPSVNSKERAFPHETSHLPVSPGHHKHAQTADSIAAEEKSFMFLCFNALDVNRDGVITWEEFYHSVRLVLPRAPMSELRTIFDSVDVGRKNSVNQNDFGDHSTEREQFLRAIFVLLFESSQAVSPVL